MKKYTVTALFAAAFLSVSMTLTGCKGKQIVDENDLPVSVQKLEKKDLQDYISVAGTVEGSNIVHVATELTAKIASVNVELGSRVKEGDVLCTFDTTELQEQYDEVLAAVQKGENLQKKMHEKNVRALNEAKTEKGTAIGKAQKAVTRATENLNNAKAGVETLKGQLNTAGQSVEAFAAEAANGAEGAAERYNEAVNLYNDLLGQIAEAERAIPSLEDALAETQDMYDQTVKNCDNAIEMAQEELDNEEYDEKGDSKKQLDALKKQLDHCVVKATCSGIVTALNIAEGSIPTTDTMMTIEDTDTLRINVSIQETDILSIHEGQTAYIKTNATGDEEFIGKVSHVVNIVSGSPSMDYYGGESQGYTAEITLEKGNSQLLIGMNAKAKIILNEEKNVLAVPYDAIVTDDDEKSTVYVADLQSGEDYKVRCVPVELGMDSEYFTAVTSTELKEGDLIITEVGRVSEGDIIKITEGYNDTVSEDSERS